MCEVPDFGSQIVGRRDPGHLPVNITMGHLVEVPSGLALCTANHWDSKTQKLRCRYWNPSKNPSKPLNPTGGVLKSEIKLLQDVKKVEIMYMNFIYAMQWNSTYDMIWIWYDMIWYDMIWYDVVWHDMTWHDMTWYDMIWYDMYVCIACYCIRVSSKNNGPTSLGWPFAWKDILSVMAEVFVCLWAISLDKAFVSTVCPCSRRMISCDCRWTTSRRFQHLLAPPTFGSLKLFTASAQTLRLPRQTIIAYLGIRIDHIEILVFE